MPRPRNPLRDYNPGISSGQAAVTLETDMGAQIVDATFVAGTPGGVNITLNSLRTSNVIGIFVPGRGQSYRYSMYEVTDPTMSAYIWGISLVNDTGQISNRNLYGHIVLEQYR